jgi:hypothetical protein
MANRTLLFDVELIAVGGDQQAESIPAEKATAK